MKKLYIEIFFNGKLLRYYTLKSNAKSLIYIYIGEINVKKQHLLTKEDSSPIINTRRENVRGFAIFSLHSNGNLCLTQFSTIIYCNRRLAVSNFSPMFTQSINFYTFYFHISQMFEKCDSWINSFFFQHFRKVYGKIWAGFCLNTGKLFSLEDETQQKEHKFFQKTIFLRDWENIHFLREHSQFSIYHRKEEVTSSTSSYSSTCFTDT